MKLKKGDKAVVTVNKKKESPEIRRGMIPGVSVPDYLRRRISPSDFIDSVFCCGFECSAINSGGAGGHWNSNNVTISTAVVRTGGHSLKVDTDGITTAFAQVYQGSQSRYAVSRFYVYFAALPDADTYISWAWGSGTLLTGMVFHEADGKLYCAKNVPSHPDYTLGASGVSITTGQWYRIDTFNDQADGAFVYRAQVDGVALGQITSAPSSSGLFDVQQIGLKDQCIATVYFDDYILSQTPGVYPIGDGYILPYVPNEDGTHNILADGNFLTNAGGVINNSTTDSYTLVNDFPMDDFFPTDTTYINQAVAGALEYVEHGFALATGATAKPPRCVEVIVSHRQAGTGVGNSTFKLIDGAEEDTIVTLSGAGVSTFNKYSRKHYNKALDDTDWTLVRLNALKHRFGFSSDADPDQYFNGAMFEAEFKSLV